MAVSQCQPVYRSVDARYIGLLYRLGLVVFSRVSRVGVMVSVRVRTLGQG